jgi:hypothetical protein
VATETLDALTDQGPTDTAEFERLMRTLPERTEAVCPGY